MEFITSEVKIALIESCVMSAAGVRVLLQQNRRPRYQVFTFTTPAEFLAAQEAESFSAVIFSLPGTREHRRECLTFFGEMVKSHPKVKRLVMANNEAEARLINQLSLTSFHGVLDKSVPLNSFAENIFAALGDNPKNSEGANKANPVKAAPRLLSPTERTILRYLTDGYSISQIASQLERNIKTIRAHKFNAMLKLGVNTDAGLLNAADMLLHRATPF